ncbi:hypothetical protein [Xanthomonas sp. 60]
MEAVIAAALHRDPAHRLAIEQRNARLAAQHARKRLIAIATLTGLVIGTCVAAAAGQRWLDGALAGSFSAMGIGVAVGALKRRTQC